MKEIPNQEPTTHNTRIEVDQNHLGVKLLVEEIQNEGSIPFSKFMSMMLYGPDGYYSTPGRPQIMRGGDFLTSPEASETFGASIGMLLRQTWFDMGKPERFTIVEMGAGKAGLAHAILKWMRILEPEFFQTINYVIVEYGNFIPLQKERLEVELQLSPNKLKWVVGDATQLPIHGVTGAMISNELPDAFPVERVKLLNGVPHVLHLTIRENTWIELWKPLSDNHQLSTFVNDYNILIPQDTEVALNVSSSQWMSQVCKALKQGIILTIDYGYISPPADKSGTAIRIFDPQKQRDPEQMYTMPGLVDITADVNFGVLEKIASQSGFNNSTGTQKELLSHLKVLDVHTKRLTNDPNHNRTDEMSGYFDIVQRMRAYRFLLSSKGVKKPFK